MFHLFKILTTSMPIAILIEQSSNFLTNEIQSNLNLLRNGSYAAKLIECSNDKQGRTFSFIKQVLNKIIQLLPSHVLVLSSGRILNHIEHFIEERCSYYSLSIDTPFSRWPL